MRQGSRGVKAEVNAKRAVGGSARKPPIAKVQANRLVAKKAPKRQGSKDRDSEKSLAEALAREKAIGEILRVMSSSPGDVQPVLDAVAERTARLCESPFARVLLVDGDVARAVAAYSLDGVSQARTSPLPLKRSTIVGRAVLDRTTIHHDDVVPLLESEYPDAVNARRLGLRAVLAVPLMREGSAYGVILLFRREPRAFSPDQVALVETFARQAAIAIENARLFNETKEALEQQTAISEILRVISSSPTDLHPVFDTIGESAMKLCAAELSVVSRVEGREIRLAAVCGTSAEGTDAVVAAHPYSIDVETLSGRTIRTRKVQQLPDVFADPSYARKEVAKIAGWRAGLGVPMLREGSVIGAIFVGRRDPGRFSDSQIALLKTFADQAAIAIENVRLFNEVQARTHELSESLQQQTATADVLKVISRSAFDLKTVLDTLTESACKLCEAEGANILRPDADGFKVAAMFGQSPAYKAALKELVIKPGRDTCSGRALLERKTVHIRDAMADREYNVPDVLKVAGNRAMIGVPLLREGIPIGVLVLTRTVARPFTEQQIALATTFADQAVIAIENVRLFREIEVKSRQLEVASQHKSEFLANMSHELRTPLNAIIGFSEVLSERLFGELNQKQAEYIGDILQSGQHLLSLINDILDLSKIEAGRMELELSDFDLPSTIENTLVLVRERAVRRGITLGRIIDEPLGTIRADERKVKQVLLNLLSNALKFTPEGGKIDVLAVVNDGAAEISVRDTGVGIAPEDQAMVFEEFRQVGTASKKVEGTGLGLAISRKFIELHGGRIWVKSEVGSGSTFAFTLPMR